MPINVIAGKPTAIIFKEGADRVIMPSPVLTRSIEIIIGKAMRSPPVKIVEDQSITDCTSGSSAIETPTGKLSKLMKSSSINIKWPSINRKIRVDSMIRNCVENVFVIMSIYLQMGTSVLNGSNCNF